MPPDNGDILILASPNAYFHAFEFAGMSDGALLADMKNEAV